MTKFSGTLPKGDANGLTALSNQLLKNPKGTHIIVGVIDVKTITTDVDTADQVATVRFRRVEAIDPEDADHAVRMMQRAAERRTGATMLPIEMEDEMRELMAALDLTTGELFDVDAETGQRVEDLNPEKPAAEPDTTAEPETPDLPERDNPAQPPAETPPDEGETGDADGTDLPAAAPETPAEQPPAETPEQPAEPPKKKRGRPTKAEAAAKKAAAEAAATAPIEDLAAETVPKAPWDDETFSDHYPNHESE